MWIINIENLINQAKKQYEKELNQFKDQPFIHCRFTFYFTLYYTIENYLCDIMPVDDINYLRYWRGKVIFQYRNKQAILTDDIHNIIEKLKLNKMVKKIEKEIRKRTGTLII
jgi:hypothetical protein